MRLVTIDLDGPLMEFYNVGIVGELYQRGDPTPMWYYYYRIFKEHLETNNRNMSAKLAAYDCNVSKVTIWKAVKAIEGK